MRWKAGSFLIGVILVFNGLTAMMSRRADAEDEYRRSLELTASLTAARLDASIANASTTLSVAAPQSELDRLTRALSMPVCSLAERVTCHPTSGAPSRTDRDGNFADETIGVAVRAAASRANASAAPLAVVARPSDDAAATAIVVAVGQPDGVLVAIMVLPADAVIPTVRVTHGDADSYAVPLETELVGGPWSAQAEGDGPAPIAGRDRLSIALQLVVGALLVAGAVVAVARDHRGLRRRATTDSLTGLPNRTEFERRASRMLADLERDGGGACLIVVDLDRFKAINDTIGHAAGDRVLHDVGTRLAAAVRSSDLVGRWGGDEFVLLLAGIDDPSAVPDRTAAIAECLSAVPGAAGSGLTASVGAAIFPLHGRDLATLLEVADRAMYEAKPPRVTDGEPDATRVPLRP